MGILKDLVSKQKAEQQTENWKEKLEVLRREQYNKEVEETYKQKYETKLKKKQSKILSPSEVLSQKKKLVRFRKEYQEHRYPRTARIKKGIASALTNKSLSRKVSGMLQRSFAQPNQRIIYRRQPRRRILPAHLQRYQFQRRQAPQFPYPNQTEAEIRFQQEQNRRLQHRIDILSPPTIQQLQRANQVKQEQRAILRESEQRGNLLKARFLTQQELGMNLMGGHIPKAEPLNFGDGGLLKIKMKEARLPFW